jgi:hypothetical protein
MAEILQTLELTEQRSQLEIFNDLIMTTADVVRVRLRGKESADGSIPLEEGAQVVQRVRDAFMAAACSAWEPRPYYERRRPNVAVDYIRKVRLGQTERGSFVVTVISPVPPELNATPIESSDDNRTASAAPIEDPYERRVVTMLAQGLRSAETAAQQAAATNELAAFQDAVPHGLSANLCEALAGLSGPDENRSVEFGFSWSRTRPVIDGIQRVSFEADEIKIIREAGRVFRETFPREDFELVGTVVKLERYDGTPSGRVTVLGLVDDRLRQVILELTDPDYHVAVKVHEAGAPIFCTGLLRREGRNYRLLQPREVAMISQE